jgi:hypothetical protein
VAPRVSTNVSSDSDLRGNVIRKLSRTACELTEGRSRLYVADVDSGIGGCGVVGTPNAALVPVSVMRFSFCEVTSFFE